MSGLSAFFPECLPVVSFLTPVSSRQAGDVNHSRPLVLMHLCSVDDWSSARACGELRPESLSSAGFIHLSTPEQVHLPANRLYRGRVDLVLLHIDSGRLNAPLRWEPGVPTDPQSMLFPHLYGPLPVEAVIDVTRYQPGPHGDFAPVAESDGGAG